MDSVIFKSVIISLTYVQRSCLKGMKYAGLFNKKEITLFFYFTIILVKIMMALEKEESIILVWGLWGTLWEWFTCAPLCTALSKAAGDTFLLPSPYKLFMSMLLLAVVSVRLYYFFFRYWAYIKFAVNLSESSALLIFCCPKLLYIIIDYSNKRGRLIQVRRGWRVWQQAIITFLSYYSILIKIPI